MSTRRPGEKNVSRKLVALVATAACAARIVVEQTEDEGVVGFGAYICFFHYDATLFMNKEF
jgi:hypothetical protein